ncbi:MAG TPA: hypothetical protein VHE53_01605 [Patescibacteria group bacterium]|nr:hypothetical protein [Patescibacteria group bacterium]
MNSHVVLAFWLLWNPIIAGLISGLIYVGPTLVYRKIREGKFYFGLYASFPVAGVAIAIISGLASSVMHGHTPQAFYTTVWFQLLLGIVTYALCIFFKKVEADDHERKKRPVEIRHLPSEKTHTYQGFPYLITLILWLALFAVDVLLSGHHLEEIGVAFVVAAVWIYVMLFIDGKKEVPKSLAEWQQVWPRLWTLCLAVALTFGAGISSI